MIIAAANFCGVARLLMDEPFAALDVQTRAKLQSFLLDGWRQSGASVIFVTHHIEEAIKKNLILRKPRSGCLEGRTAPIPAVH